MLASICARLTEKSLGRYGKIPMICVRFFLYTCTWSFYWSGHKIKGSKMITKPSLNVAVVGATGLVGETILSILHTREFPVGELYPLASSNSAGDTVLFGNKNYEVLEVDGFDFASVDLAFFSAGSEVSAKYAPIASAAGCVVIDNTAQFRQDAEVPLVIPEINPEAIADYKKCNIIANPNCSTIIMLMALYPLYKSVGINEINVATYQSVSGTGRAAISELVEQLGLLLNGRPVNTEVYPRQIALNVLPQVDDLLEDGSSKEELKMLQETHKILQDPNIKVNTTAVRVPVIYGHSEAITINTSKPLTASAAIEVLQQSPGIEVMAQHEDYPTALELGVESDTILVGRIRNTAADNQLQLWVVGDNVRKGAALNSVQIAELLCK